LFPDPARHTISADLDGDLLAQCEFVAVAMDRASS